MSGGVPAGWVLVPVEPTHQMIRAAAESVARDDEGAFEPVMDLLGFSGENKTRTVLRQLLTDAIAATPTPPPSWDADVERVRKVAKEIARANGDEFANAFANKARWIAKRGMSGGRFRDASEPFQSDYLEMARAALQALGERG